MAICRTALASSGFVAASCDRRRDEGDRRGVDVDEDVDADAGVEVEVVRSVWEVVEGDLRVSEVDVCCSDGRRASGSRFVTSMAPAMVAAWTSS